ncbi:MAG TPA: hypothetical protein VIG51_00945 [Candidatus Baltobacteraceae bacterium]|jgi:predicted transcriptional regulator
MDDRLFGSQIRTDTLVAIGRLERTYASEIARTIGRRLVEVQRAVVTLERAGVVVTTKIGTTRITELQPRFWAKDEIYALLLRLSEMPRYRGWWTIRRRPRAIGKPL